MKDAFHQSMSWLHTWSGLVVGWVLFFVFLTGTIGYFDTEVDRWMRPELPITEQRMPAAQAVDFAVTRLSAEAPEARRWFFALPVDRNDPILRLFWQQPPRSGERGAFIGRDYLDNEGRSMAVRETGGGQTLYKMHRRLYYLPGLWAEWIIGICSMFMLVGIVTGVVVHKRIFADFFTFRPGKGQRSWLDMHNVLAVLALPFHLMITWSGLVFFLNPLLLPTVNVAYGGNQAGVERFFDDLFSHEAPPRRAGMPAPLPPFSLMLAEAGRHMDIETLRYVSVFNVGDANARITFTGGPETVTQETVRLSFDATGKLLTVSEPRSAPLVSYYALVGLHEGLFAGPWLRWLYFLAGLAGTAMIGTGLVLWLVKRRAVSGATFGFRLVEGLNIGTLVGLPIAIAGYFWANRLIPADLAGRAAWEVHALYLAWAVLLLHAFLRPPHRAWLEQCCIAALAFCLLPVLNALTTDKHLGAALPAGQWALAGFDLTMLAFGFAFGVAAWRISRKKSQAMQSARQPVGPARASA